MEDNHYTDENIRELEASTDLSQRYTLYITVPMKLTLHELARSRHQTMADIVRTALPKGLADAYPEYENIYRKHLTRK